jgi:phenylalanine-4-hydroxylase
MGDLSEMAKIRNLHWWTVEYGLIGTISDPKIYGAGLLSSIGESKWCLQPEVKKLPYSLDAAHLNFDITKPQPQLFVTPDFAYLSLVLEEFANTMALRTGGLEGIEKLIDSQSLGTVELSTGIQISGNFSEVIKDEKGRVAYLQTNGPTALASRDNELIGHSTLQHADGFGSPVGKLKGINLPIEDMAPRDLDAYGIYEGKNLKLEFESGVVVEGRTVTGTRDRRGKILLITLEDCTVRHFDHVLFKPEWGVYHMAVGKEVISAYAGPADVNSFSDVGKVSDTKTHKIAYSDRHYKLYQMYDEVREMRENDIVSELRISEIFKVLKSEYEEDWLLNLEMYELAESNNLDVQNELLSWLNVLKSREELTKLIQNGLDIIHKPNLQQA